MFYDSMGPAGRGGIFGGLGSNCGCPDASASRAIRGPSDMGRVAKSIFGGGVYAEDGIPVQSTLPITHSLNVPVLRPLVAPGSGPIPNYGREPSQFQMAITHITPGTIPINEFDPRRLPIVDRSRRQLAVRSIVPRQLPIRAIDPRTLPIQQERATGSPDGLMGALAGLLGFG